MIMIEGFLINYHRVTLSSSGERDRSDTAMLEINGDSAKFLLLDWSYFKNSFNLKHCLLPIRKINHIWTRVHFVIYV